MQEILTTRVEEFSGGFPAEIKTAWEACTQASPEGKRFLTPDWAECWLRTVGSEPPWSGRCRLFMVQTSSGRVVAVFPLAIGRIGRARVLTPPGFYQPFRGFVCLPEFADEAVPMIVDAFHAHRRSWDILRIFPYYVRTPEQSLFMERLQSRFPNIRIGERGRTIVNTLSERYEDYARLESARKVEACGRRLARATPYAIEHFHCPRGRDADRLLDALRDIEGRSWLVREQGDLRFTSDANRRFWRDAINASLSPRGQLNAWILSAGDVPVAFRFCIITGSVSYLIANQYDEAYSKFSPGWMLYLRELEYDCAHGIRRIDMGPGDLHYKGRWGGQDDAMQLEVTAFAPTWPGRLAAGLYAGSCLSARLRQTLKCRAAVFREGMFARAATGLVTLWRLRQSAGMQATFARIRHSIWHRSRTVLFESGPIRSEVALPQGMHVVKIRRDDRAIPLEDIEKAGAGTDIVNLNRGAICYLAYRLTMPVGLGWMFMQSYLLDRLGYAGKALYLAGYHVVPSARGQGIYPLLLKTMVYDAAARGMVCLVDASPDNQPSIRGIEKAGFRRLGTLDVLIVCGTILRATLVQAPDEAEPKACHER